MVKGMKKRLLSVLLALLVIIGILPAAPAMAASTVPLSSLTAGDTVNFAGYTWIVLDPSTGYLFIQDNYVPPSDPSGYVQFDTAESPLNWFVGSSMETLLNNTFYNSLPSADRALIQKHTWDYGSVAYDASVTYGTPQTAEDYVGLISFKDWTNYSTQWNQVSGFLEPTEHDVWTLSTVNGDSQKVWSLEYEYGGRIHSKSITEYALVRPALYLNPSVPVTGGVGGTILPFDPGQSTVTVSPSQVPADGFDSSTVTVTLKDSGGNPASGIPVQLTPSSGNTVITPFCGTTDSNGKAAFTVTNSVVESVTYTATDTLDNATAGTAQVQFVPVKTVTLNWSSLNLPYYDAVVIVTGTDTHFVSGTTTLRIFNSGGTDVAGSVTLTVNSETEAEFYLPDNLPADTYTVILTTGSEVAVATLTVNSQAAEPTISAQPQNTTANAGSTATFSVAASSADGGTLSYQWQSLKSGGSWTNVGTNAASYTTPALTASDSGTEFRCKVTNTNSTGAKNTVNSDAATLYVSGAGLTLPLASLSAGDTVNFAGYTWIVLDPSEGYLLMKNLYNWCAYDSSHKSFDVAAIRSLLNSTLYNSLPSADSAQIQKHNWPVFDIALDGTVGDGANVNDSIGLLTYQEWQAYSKHYTASGFLDNPSNRFWTLTKVTDYGYVWYVDTDGALKYMSPAISAYARPALYLDPDIQLSGNGGSGSTVLPFDVSQSTVTASPGKLAADGTASSTVTVTLKDSDGTPLSGVAVTLASSSGNSVITAPSGGSGGGSAGASAHGTTDSNGTVAFTVTDSTAEQVTCTATAAVYGNTTLGTANIEFAALKFTSAGSTIFTVDKAGSFTVVVTGSTAPSLTITGSLPTGVSFTDNGDSTATIAGTANVGGTYPLVITAVCTDLNLMLPSVSQNFTIKINRVPAEKAPLPTMTATVGASTAFNASDIAEDADGDTLTITSITSAPASGTATAVLSGRSVTVTGVAPGSASVEVAVSDGTDTVNISVPITVDSAKPTITTTSLVSGKINEAYSAVLSATGDTPITWSVESGSLPDGLSISGNTISGTATSRGTFTFTVKAENSLGSDTKELSIVIIGIAPTITTTTYGGLHNGTQGEYYCDTLTATGDGPITWTIYSGSLPPGLTLDANTGVIYGIPTQANGYGIYVKATNSAGSDTKWLQLLTYTEFAVITTNSLSGGTVGSAYSEELSARGNTPITWSVESGSLPDGLSLTDNTITGTPTNAGTFTFTLKASNHYGTDRMTFTIVVNASNATVPVTNISNVPATATVDIPLALTGTVEPADATNNAIVWSVQDAGTTGATVSGNILTITAVGTVTVRATVTDSTTGNPDYTQEFAIVVKAHPPIVTGVTVSPSAVSVQAENTQTFTAIVSGTYNPAQTVTWSVSGNNSEYTTINSSGLLTVDLYETATALTVTATSTADNTKSGTATVTVILAQLEYQSVWDIYDVPTKATAGTPLTLTGTVDPYYATNQTIVWSVYNAGTTGATVSGNTLSTTAAGTVTVRATITNGRTENSDYTQDFNITVKAASPTVTGVIVSPPAVSVQKGNTQTFTATVSGTNGPTQTVTWSVYGNNSGSTSINASGLLTVAADETAATLTVTATSTADNTKSGTGTVTVTATPPAFEPVTGITAVPATATAGTPLTLSGTVTPNNATNQTIVWSMLSAGTTGATLSGNTLSTTAEGSVTVRATITNGLTESSDYTQDFNITVNPAPVTDAAISPGTGSFDKYTPADVQTTVTWGSATGVTDVKAGGTSIGASNYSVSGNMLTIKKEYLGAQSTGSLSLTVEFNAGASATLTIAVTDTSPPTISPLSRNYDLSVPADVTTTISWNSAASVTNMVYTVSPDTTLYTLGTGDYTVSGNALTIKNSFFSDLALTTGVALEFDITFNTGATATLTVNVVNGYTPSDDADLSSLLVNGTLVSGFDPDDTEYDVALPCGAASATVTATANDSNAQVSITQASSWPGNATVTVTAEDGTTSRTYTINLTITPPAFVPVTGITGVPTAASAGANLTLSGTVTPASAINQTIVWSVYSAGDTGATISGNTLSTTAAGTVTVRATITNGLTAGTDYTQDFTISVSATSGGSPSGGGSTAPASSTYNAEVNTGNGPDVKLPVTVDKSSGSASVNVGTGNDFMSGGQTTVITVPSIPDVDTYMLGIPVPSLSTQDEQGSLAFKTDTGTVTIPSNMLTGVAGISGSKAEISIGQGDKDSLSSDVKTAIGDKPLISLSLSIDGKQTDWSNPNAPVTVSIPYTPTAAELANPKSIVIWYIDGSGNAVSVPNGHYDPETGTVTFTTTHFSNYAVVYNKVSFTDVSDTAWYSNAVGFISARGITTGTGNGCYSPDAKLTRGEFMVMMMRAYGIVPDESPTDNFSDAGRAYYTGYLAAAKRLGISVGMGNNMFAPDKEITRQEMFTLLYNALKVIGQLPEGNSGKTLTDFTDAGQIDSWAKDTMSLLVETGSIIGSGGKLNPIGTTSRAEMAQVLYILLMK